MSTRSLSENIRARRGGAFRPALLLGTVLLLGACFSAEATDIITSRGSKLSFGVYSNWTGTSGDAQSGYVDKNHRHGWTCIQVAQTEIKGAPAGSYVWLKEVSTSGIFRNGARYYPVDAAASSLGIPDSTGVCTRWSKVKVPQSGLVTRKATIGQYASIDYTYGAYNSVGVSAIFRFDAYSTYGGIMPLPDRTYVAPMNRGHAPMYHKGDDPVDLATGQDTFAPGPDIAAYNPYGPAAVHTIECSTLRAEQNYASPGLTVGWTDGYDVKITPSDPATWSDLTLHYPNGAVETLTPNLNGDQPDGTFDAPSGSSYYVTGIASSTTGEWQSITMTFKDQNSWTFTETSSNIYMLSRIANRMGRFINIQRDVNSNCRITSVADDSTAANTLLTYTYTGSHLSSITDVYGRKVTYAYAQKAGAACLVEVSHIGPSSAASISSLHTYDYVSVVGTGQTAQPHLSSVTSPSPTGSGTSTQSITYNSDGQVGSLSDANGNVTEFNYESPDGTAVQVKNQQGVVQSAWKSNFNPASHNLETGATDAAGYSTQIAYEDSRFPDKPTKVTDKGGRASQMTYDDHGNVVSVTNSRGTATVYTYSYTDFQLGRLISVQEGDRPQTTFTYYEPSGLLHTITWPRPGTTAGTETVTTTYTYDDLGNVLTVTAPGNPDDQATTYNYTQDGTYTQAAKLGQPLTVTDNLGHVTHYRYDDRGNTIWATDALGNRTDFTYNIADQLATTIGPSTSTP